MFCLDASDEAEAAFERMLGACKVVLAWYGGVLEEGFECVPTPPMGSHIIRRRSIGDNDELDAQHHTHMANLGEFLCISVFILILIRAIGLTACFVQLFITQLESGLKGTRNQSPRASPRPCTSRTSAPTSTTGYALRTTSSTASGSAYAPASRWPSTHASPPSVSLF